MSYSASDLKLFVGVPLKVKERSAQDGEICQKARPRELVRREDPDGLDCKRITEKFRGHQNELGTVSPPAVKFASATSAEGY